MIERREIQTFPGYLLDTEGRIYSIKSKRYLRPGKDHRGYLRVELSIDGTVYRAWVHRLMGETFLGPLPPGMHTRHLNGDKQDNRLANLSYGTVKENSADTRRHGRTLRGSKNHWAQLTEDKVLAIRLRVERGESARSLAKEYGVGRETIFDVSRGRTWKHVTGPLAPTRPHTSEG